MTGDKITVSLYDDKGTDLVFRGRALGEFEAFESDNSALKLYVSIFSDDKRFFGRVISKNLGHPRSGVCHSSARHSIAPLETRIIYEGNTLLMLIKQIKTNHPQVNMDDHFSAIIRNQLATDGGMEP